MQILPQFVIEEFKVNPIYVLFAPLRHYIIALMFRNAAEKLYGKKLKIFTNPLVILLFALAPDIDSYIGIPHRIVTHSLVFAAIIGTAVWMFAVLTKKKNVGAYLLLSFAIVASHVADDTLIEGGDVLNPFWPLGQAFQLHTGQDWIGHLFTIIGIVYLWKYYGWGEKLARILKK